MYRCIVVLLLIIAPLYGLAQEHGKVKVVEHYDNGQRRYTYVLRNGQKHGKHLSWYESGQLQSKVKYHQGKLNGESIYFHADGSLHKKENYLSDGLHGTIEIYYPSGKLRFYGTYDHNVLKYYRQYLPDGTLDREEQL